MGTLAYCISCKDVASGKIGSFMYSNDRPFHALSPVFPSLVGLIHWLTVNGYETERDLVSFRVFKREP